MTRPTGEDEMIEMTDERAAEVLAAHNEWRRYDGFPGEPGAPVMGDVKELGHAIDHAVSRLRSQPPAEAQPVAWTVLQIGATGSAYDAPDTRRAFTYGQQPGNVLASKLGGAANAAAAASAGDSIDRGLSLLKALQESGFGVFQLEPSSTVSPPSAPVGVEGFVAWFNNCGVQDRPPSQLARAAWEAALAQQPAAVEGVAEVQRLRAENHRLMMVCQSAHDRLLRGDENAEVLALLEDAWTGPPNPTT